MVMMFMYLKNMIYLQNLLKMVNIIDIVYVFIIYCMVIFCFLLHDYNIHHHYNKVTTSKFNIIYSQYSLTTIILIYNVNLICNINIGTLCHLSHTQHTLPTCIILQLIYFPSMKFT